MNERAEANLNDGDNVKNLILSLISVIVLIFFGFKIFNNMAKLFFNYYGEIFKIHEKNKSDDDNNYLRDEVEFKNKSNEILKNRKEEPKINYYTNYYSVASIFEVIRSFS